MGQEISNISRLSHGLVTNLHALESENVRTTFFTQLVTLRNRLGVTDPPLDPSADLDTLFSEYQRLITIELYTQANRQLRETLREDTPDNRDFISTLTFLLGNMVLSFLDHDELNVDVFYDLGEPSFNPTKRTLNLPIEKYQGEAYKCSICLEDILQGAESYSLTCCQGVYHSRCLNGWGNYRATCPRCRTELPCTS